MAACTSLLSALKLNRLASASRLNVRNIFTSSATFVEQDWRVVRGLPRNPNAYGPLTDNRDFSHVDGQPVPIGTGQKRRLIKNKEYADKICNAVKEMDFAVERHQRLIKEADEKVKAILHGKLKPKGHLIMKKGQ